METEHFKLIPFTEEHYQAIMNDDNIRLSELLETKTPDSWTTFDEARKAINALYEFFKALKNDLRWGSYFIIHKGDHRLIGTCGYKGLPDEQNFVEIGYEIHPDYQKRGFATMVAKTLVHFAFSNGIPGIKAHTLPNENASVSVLRKCGFRFMATEFDPEDGKVWYWLLEKNNAPCI